MESEKDYDHPQNLGWMNVFIYAGDIYCEDCGYAIQAKLDAKGNRDTGDSNDYPQGPYPDGGGESDSPQHCGSGAGCVNAVEFAGTKVGIWLSNPLTRDGVEALKKTLSNPRPSAYQLALHKFWSRVYGDYLNDWEPPAVEPTIGGRSGNIADRAVANVRRLPAPRTALAKRFRIGSRVTMSADAIENYGPSVTFQQGKRLKIYSKGPQGQPLEAPFWYTVDTQGMTLHEIALQFAQTGQPGTFIEIVSPPNSAGTRPRLKWTFRVERHAGQPAVTRVRSIANALGGVRQ